jgi:hypothetical protein
MKWDFSFRLHPGESVIEKEGGGKGFGLKSIYSPVLTDKRVAFRFNSLTSNMTQSFNYEEISEVQTTARLLIKYLRIISNGKAYLFNIDSPEKWAAKIIQNKERFKSPEKTQTVKARPSLTELLSMLETLKEYGLLTEQEFEEKRKNIM